MCDPDKSKPESNIDDFDPDEPITITFEPEFLKKIESEMKIVGSYFYTSYCIHKFFMSPGSMGAGKHHKALGVALDFYISIVANAIIINHEATVNNDEYCKEIKEGDTEVATIKELMEFQNKNISTIRRWIKRLIKKGYIEQISHPEKGYFRFRVCHWDIIKSFRPNMA